MCLQYIKDLGRILEKKYFLIMRFCFCKFSHVHFSIVFRDLQLPSNELSLETNGCILALKSKENKKVVL